MKVWAKLFILLLVANFLAAESPKNYLQKLKIAGSAGFTGIYTILGLGAGINCVFNLCNSLESQDTSLINNEMVLVKMTKVNMLRKFILGFLIDAGLASGFFDIAGDFYKLTQKQYNELDRKNILSNNRPKGKEKLSKYNDKDLQDLLTDTVINSWISVSMILALIKNMKIINYYFNFGYPQDKISTYTSPFLALACLHVIFKNSKQSYKILKIIFDRWRQAIDEQKAQALKIENQKMVYSQLNRINKLN